MPLPKPPAKKGDLLRSADYEAQAAPRTEKRSLKTRAAEAPAQSALELLDDSPALAAQSFAPSPAPSPAQSSARSALTSPAAITKPAPAAFAPLTRAPAPAPAPRVRKPRSTGPAKLFVLDTNVLMHDPTALFKFEEHDVFIPMMVLEELDNGKKGHSEASRNARQVSRFLNELVEANGSNSIEQGIPLVQPKGLQLRDSNSVGRLHFQLKPVEVGKRFGNVMPDNLILGSILQLRDDNPGMPVVLVSKDINLRIKASICNVTA